MNETSLGFPWWVLLDWYTENGRHDLEWRNYSMDEDIRAYRVWLSEICLQQTQVERVRGYFIRILERYPTIHDLAWASYEEYFPYYQGIGYYSRARNMLATAKMVSDTYTGSFPREKSLLEKLPGVWWYTSSAILAFAYGEPYLAWDTNLEKVLARYFHGSRLDRLIEEEKESIEEEFRVFAGGNPKKVRAVNNALMDFAATVDMKNPSNIDWENYPIRSGIFYETRGSLEPLEMKKTQSFPTPDATLIVVLHQDHKIYYSLTGDTYSPFILNPSLSRDTRKYVQDYFREHYGLELSVRPAHKKWISKDGKPYIAVNAQIQTGDPSQFREYSKKEKELFFLKWI